MKLDDMKRKEMISIPAKKEEVSQVDESLLERDRNNVNNSKVLVKGMGTYQLGQLKKEIIHECAYLLDMAKQGQFRAILSNINESSTLKAKVSSLIRAYEDLENERKTSGGIDKPKTRLQRD